LGIVALGGQIERINDKVFHVRSQNTPDKYYTVKWVNNEWYCDCVDYLKRKKPCKHVYAVKFLLNLPLILLMNYEGFEHKCPYCGSTKTILKGFRYNKQGAVRIRKCKECNKWFKDVPSANHKGNNTLFMIISLDLYYKGLSLREIKHHLEQIYNVEKPVSTLHRWILKLTDILRGACKKLRTEIGERWLADETVVKVNGEEKYLWNILDYETRFHIISMLADGRNTEQALTAIVEAVKGCEKVPKELVTDGLKSYSSALRILNLPLKHIGNAKISDKENNNNRVERLNETLKDWIKSKRGLKEHAREVVEGYRVYYNFIRPHMALGDIPPSGRKNTWLSLVMNREQLVRRTNT